MDIGPTGAWQNETDAFFAKEHKHDAKLAKAITKLAKELQVTRMYDFGCGDGKYVSQFPSCWARCRRI